jgi:hypothetical protein
MNPASPYYQAWIGGYAVKAAGRQQPPELEHLIRVLTTLDQRSWLEAMGDAHPLAELDTLEISGVIVIDGARWPLWRIAFHSHSDLPAGQASPLARLLGVPPESERLGVPPFQGVVLRGRIAGHFDFVHQVAILIYEVLADPPRNSRSPEEQRRLDAELVNSMTRARVRTF